MDLVDVDGVRALTYLAALERSGYFPTIDQLESYVEKPSRTSESAFTALTSSFRRAFAYTDESLINYLARLDWVTFSPDGVKLTRLGRAVYAAMSREERSSEESDDVVLDHDDPIVLARLLHRIGGVGEALLIDPYFRLEHLMSVLQTTGVNRVLTSERSTEPDLRALAVALGTLEPSVRTVEVRVADKKLHDRHVIGADGTVLFIGASLNGIGKVTSVVGELKDGASQIVDTYEQIWRLATPLEPIEPTSNLGPVPAASK